MGLSSSNMRWINTGIHARYAKAPLAATRTTTNSIIDAEGRIVGSRSFVQVIPG
jgi:hypothetical protein